MYCRTGLGTVTRHYRALPEQSHCVTDRSRGGGEHFVNRHATAVTNEAFNLELNVFWSADIARTAHLAVAVVFIGGWS